MLPPVVLVLQCWEKSHLVKGFLGGAVKKIHLPMQEIEETQVLGRGDPLENETAKPSCILAQKPQIRESGGLLSMGLQRVRHD